MTSNKNAPVASQGRNSNTVYENTSPLHVILTINVSFKQLGKYRSNDMFGVLLHNFYFLGNGKKCCQ